MSDPWQGGGGGGGASLFGFKQAGTSPFEVYYSQSNQVGATSPFAPAIGTLHLVPFIGRSGVLDRIAFEVTILAAGGVARAGIYNSTSRSNIYPTTLVVDGGEISTATTGVKIATISTSIVEGSLYWFAYLTGTLAATLRTCPSGTNLNSILGYPATLGGVGAFSGLTVAQAYGAMPGTFPGGGVMATSAAPLLAVRYSA